MCQGREGVAAGGSTGSTARKKRGMDAYAQFTVSLLFSSDPPSPWNYTDHIWSEPFLHNPVTSSQTWDGAGVGRGDVPW